MDESSMSLMYRFLGCTGDAENANAASAGGLKRGVEAEDESGSITRARVSAPDRRRDNNPQYAKYPCWDYIVVRGGSQCEYAGRGPEENAGGLAQGACFPRSQKRDLGHPGSWCVSYAGGERRAPMTSVYLLPEPVLKRTTRSVGARKLVAMRWS